MAEDSDLERTEPPTPRRLEQAREKGQVPRSPELTTFAVLLAAGGSLSLFGATFAGRLETLMTAGLTLDRAAAFRADIMGARLYALTVDALLAFAPLFAVVAAAALAAPMLLSGWLVSAEAVTPQFSRLNPLNGLQRMFSWHALIELVKALLKAAVVGAAVVWIVSNDIAPLVGLSTEPPRAALGHLGSMLGFSFLVATGALTLVVIIDVPFQIWEHRKQLRMTKEEVRQELKETEGDPMIKGRIRQLQREAARRRMMGEVPKADVVVVNPTEFAVALRYREANMRAPTVVAKGAALLAARISELAREHGVPVVRVPPLARALHAHAELGKEIPAPLYTAVAEVLAYVYQLERFETGGGERPEPPAGTPVPPELDPALDEGGGRAA
ncbi:MAG: flagellar biosynthesis protein FlhB [Betaproteobacteria bacterium]|jgi:flagellar biosynthetic protein FlhB|nr:flagellar type III secretion system protein FlhB [Rhodocyclaceae bacterium]MCA3135957.1 flagellar type III secretion system protein FlhB [Rhodocyclaceae bacterium]MCA3141653.1 flagellar type III secretion system protein FlhB [Rhodocyclaceae bacterium]MCA3145329.1 flagellar type III secretion system protein FlhB [Rhodocyclaceae bacterium]MCE2896797.1 flagellar type III secretion system protein FlhB [Betaproteobacteria bacterium]